MAEENTLKTWLGLKAGIKEIGSSQDRQAALRNAVSRSLNTAQGTCSHVALPLILCSILIICTAYQSKKNRQSREPWSKSVGQNGNVLIPGDQKGQSHD